MEQLNIFLATCSRRVFWAEMAFAESAVQLLFKENSRDDFLVASELLLRLAGNVLENPQESKYRRIRIANPLLESKLLPVVGGIECLFEMGFLEVCILISSRDRSVCILSFVMLKYEVLIFSWLRWH